MAITEKPGHCQTQRIWPVGHNTENRGRFRHTVQDGLSDATATRGENHKIRSSTLSNGNVPEPYPCSRRGAEGNSLHNERWIPHKTGGGTFSRSQERASRLRTVGAFQAAPLQRRTNDVLQMPVIQAPQSHMSQPRVLCNLQRQTRDKCLHKETQGGTSYNGAMRKLQREPSCMESQMPRMSETDPQRTMPGHNPAKKRKDSYTEEAENLGNCPISTGNIKNRLLCGNVKGSSEASTNPQVPKGEKATKGKKTHQDCRAAIKARCGRKFPQGKEGPGTSRQVDSKGQSRNKENCFCTNTDISYASTRKETQTPRRERKESVTQTSPVKTPVTKTPTTLKEGAYSLSGQQLVVMMQTFATALAAQLNITLHTEQVKNATRATLNASKFLSKINEDKTRRQNKMSISLDAGMNTSMDITDH